MKRKFDPKLTDKESPEFKELETKILDKFRAGFEKIAQEKGMEVDLSVTFVEEGAARKRRNTEGGNTQAIIDATYSSTDESTDLSTMESDLSGSVRTAVTETVTANAGGDDLIDETAEVEVATTAEVEGPIDCTDDESTLEDAITVCSGAQQGLIVPFCALETRGFFYETVSMGDNELCLGTRTGDNVEFYADDANCAVTPTPNGTHILYTSAIQSSRGMSND